MTFCRSATRAPVSDDRAMRARVFYHQRLDPVLSVPVFFGFNLVAGKTDTNA